MPDSITALYGDRDMRLERAEAVGDDLWLPLDELTSASGWVLKPEGACLGPVCVPIPPDRRERFLRGDGVGARFNLAELARLLEMPVVTDAATGTWCFGESAQARGAQLASLEAPDFTLPDLDGRMHSLNDYRGMKVFMVAWASW